MNSQVDLMVVGAGVLGTFHAYHAAALGKKVLLVEKDQYPIQSTVRNFGQAVPSGLSSAWFEYGLRGTEIYKSIQQEFDISVRNNGTVYLASDTDEQQLIHELKNRMDQRSYEAHLLSREACLQKWPALNPSYCKEGIFFPQEVSVEPEFMIYRLLEYCIRKFQHLSYKPLTTILSCVAKEGGVEIQTNHLEKITAEKVIICNGTEFSILFPELFSSSGIVVSKLQMMRTHPMPQVAMEGNILTGLSIRRYESFEECPSFSNVRTPSHLEELKKWGIHILFKKASDGSIIIGDSHEYADVLATNNLGFALNDHINKLMLNEASRIVTFPLDNIASYWAGYYSQHAEKDIVEYDLNDRIHIRTAIGGKGMTSSAGYAESSIKKLFHIN